MTEKERENNRSRILVRIGDFQIELEGTHENVRSLMGEPLFEFIRNLQSVVGEIPTPEAEVPIVEEAPPTEYPPPLGRPATLGAALTKLMVETGWGSKPRTLGEIVTALETSGIYHKKAAIATTLVTLMKRGVLRRLGSRRNYKYVAA